VPERLISADSHVRITHKQIKSYLTPRLHDAYDEAAGAYDRRMMTGAGAANQAGAKMQKKQDRATTANSAFSRAAYSDPVERLKDMDSDGVDVEVIYSEVSAFRYLSNVKDGVSETLQAFNDALHDFGSIDPKRLVMSYQVPIHDIDLAISEVRRVVGLGAKSLQLPVFPNELGQPDYYHERYTPLFELIQDTGLPICCHIGLKTGLSELADRDPTPNKGIMVPMTPLATGEAFGMWVMGGVLERFPDLKVVFVEPGIAWVAWWIEMVDDMVTRQGYEFPAIRELPSFYMRRNVYLTFIDEKCGPQRMRDLIGIENMMWSTDFPHPVTSWPNSRAVVEEQFASFSPAERQLVVAGNAKRIWNLH
jgi:uncharacterized protein